MVVLPIKMAPAAARAASESAAAVAAAGHALIASKGKVDGEGGAETKARLSLELLAFVPALALLVGEVANSPVRRLLPQELLTGMGVQRATGPVTARAFHR